MRVLFAVAAAVVQTAAQVTGGRLVCRVVGHDPSWWLGVSCHGLDRPVCARCSKVL